MIKAVIRYGVHSVELTATGHAGYAPEGQDIVCAAVSVLLDTLAAVWHGREGCGITRRPGDYRFRLTWPGDETHGEIPFVVAGLRLLAAAYPRHVSVDIRFDDITPTRRG